MMTITVIVCTYNRCQSLAKALGSVVTQTLPESVEWGVLVVDNNSNDQTRQVVEEFSYRYAGRFHYLFEPQQGLSHARNAGIREAQGDILAFTDDDVVVEPTWLQTLTAGLQEGRWAGAGGRTLPEKAFSPPRWLSLADRYALAPLAIFDLGPDARELTEAPFGNNMAFRRAVFEKYGGFRTDLGRCGESLISGEDTEFADRLLEAGERLYYQPLAVVYHPVTKNRVQKDYVLAWWFSKGRTEIRQSGIHPGTKWCFSGIPLFMFRRLAVWTLRWMVASEPARRFGCRRKVWTTAGAIVESYQQSRDAKRKSALHQNL